MCGKGREGKKEDGEGEEKRNARGKEKSKGKEEKGMGWTRAPGSESVKDRMEGARDKRVTKGTNE